MTRRDIGWRLAGAALTVGGCTASLLAREGSPLTIVLFLLAIAGLVLMLNGKRVAVALMAERRGHPNTASVIHAWRIARERRAGAPGDRRR